MQEAAKLVAAGSDTVPEVHLNGCDRRLEYSPAQDLCAAVGYVVIDDLTMTSTLTADLEVDGDAVVEPIDDRDLDLARVDPDDVVVLKVCALRQRQGLIIRHKFQGEEALT
jgi:endonuclease V-like protein UPF0215 family